MDYFEKLEALVESADADAVEIARNLLSPFFLLDLITLVFLVEAGREASPAFGTSSRSQEAIAFEAPRIVG